MINIFFSPSAAGTFRQLLQARGVSEKVACLDEGLDFGPVSHEPLSSRESWFNKHVPLAVGPHDWFAENEARFRKSIASDSERLIWIAPASASEQAGFYWYLSHYSKTGLKLAVADFQLSGTWIGEVPLRLGELTVEAMGQLYDECPRINWDPTRFPKDRWNILVSDNSLLRVVMDGHLQSVPDDYFDDFLLACCPDQWVKWPRVVADAMGKIWHTGQSAGGDLLLWRLNLLIEQNRIACQGASPLFGQGADAARVKRIK